VKSHLSLRKRWEQKIRLPREDSKSYLPLATIATLLASIFSMAISFYTARTVAELTEQKETQAIRRAKLEQVLLAGNELQSEYLSRGTKIVLSNFAKPTTEQFAEQALEYSMKYPDAVRVMQFRTVTQAYFPEFDYLNIDFIDAIKKAHRTLDECTFQKQLGKPIDTCINEAGKHYEIAASKFIDIMLDGRAQFLLKK
jgi:hypothetical protein